MSDEKKYLKQLTDAVLQCLEAIDTEMKLPSTHERGQRIAKICNALEIANDLARRFGLGIGYRKDKKRIEKTPRG